MRPIDADNLDECKEIMNTIDGESMYAVRMDDIRSMPTTIVKGSHSVAYLCKEHGEGNTCPQDGSTCSYDMCKHTTDVKYAKNFVQVSDDSYMEVSDRWIPCTSAKPEPDRDVIFCDVDGDIYKGLMYDNGDWYDDAYDDPVKNVVAWMPLPEPYRKEGDKV